MQTLSIISTARDALRGLMLSLCELVYSLISFCFQVFYNLGKANILNNDILDPIFKNIGLIIGIFMIFRVTFAFVQYIVDPNMMTDKNKGAQAIIKKVIIVIVLLGSTRYLFKAAFDIQNQVLNSQILEKVILGKEFISSEQGTAMDEFGSNLSATIFTTFYRINPEAPTSGDTTVYNLCKELLGENNEALRNQIRVDGLSSTGANICLTSKAKYETNNDSIEEIVKKNKDTEENYIVQFDGDGLAAAITGIICLYLGFMFTFQVGIRTIQLAYLQVVAPIPIIMYITPKGEDNLKKWATQCVTTFLDFFLRIAIVYFAVFIIKVLTSDIGIKAIYEEGTTYNVYVTCVMIIATLMFVKKVPNLLKEIFPSLGGAAGFSFDLSGKAFKDTMKMAYKATPIGWGLKLGKNGVISAIGAIDRKKYGLPKPRTKLQEKIDKLTPGRAEAIKNERAGAVARMERDQLYREGEEYYNMFSDHEIKDENGKLRAGVFQNSAYAESWQKVADAKKLTKRYDAELADVQAKLARGEITVESEEYKSAVGNAKAANGRLEAAKQDHENIRKIYTKDARREDAYNYYHDMQFDVPSNVTPQTNNNNNSQSSDIYRRVNEVTGISRPSASENGAPTADNSLLGELASQVEQEQPQRDFQNNLRNENNANNNTSNSHDNRQYSNGDDVGE